ncbi:MAG: protein-export chaperone SecB [Prevotella sp.]|jgi:preprotein translocase subunit SecB|nr:protein-export chaperone SecB [Prevotella sp.]
MEQNISKFRFKGYKITHSELNISGEQSENTEYSIGINAKGKAETDNFILTLDVSISSNDNSIDANVVVEGTFNFNKEISKEILNSLFCANAPAIMFPYVRAYISTLTALSGVDTVVIPTLAMTPLGEEIKESLSEQ